MSKKIISVGYSFPGSHGMTIDFTSKKSLMDADLVIFSPEKGYSYDYQDGYESHNGKNVYDQNSSGKIKEDINHWHREISSYLNGGKTVFFFLKAKEEFYLVNGFTYTGSGRTTTKQLSTELYDNYRCLPVNIGELFTASGTEIVGPFIPLFKPYHDLFEKMLSYESYFVTDVGKTIYLTKSGNRKLSALFNIGKGNLIILPYLDFSNKKFSYTKGDESFWTKEAIEIGTDLIKTLINIDKIIQALNLKSPPPNWVSSNKYLLNSEIEITKKIKEKEIDELKLKQEIKLLKDQLYSEIAIKDLLFESGKLLENAVIQALQLLGYDTEEYNDGKLELDQVILSPENNRFIGECEGKENKAIDIDKVRQLVDELNEDLTKEKVKERAIGILFGNPQRFENPEKRNLNFTEKAMRAAEREKIALILTKDLFNIAKYLKENPDEKFKSACRKTIVENLGKIIIFPQIPHKNLIVKSKV